MAGNETNDKAGDKMHLLQITHIKRVRLSPTGYSLTQQHFTFHDGEKKD